MIFVMASILKNKSDCCNAHHNAFFLLLELYLYIFNDLLEFGLCSQFKTWNYEYKYAMVDKFVFHCISKM